MKNNFFPFSIISLMLLGFYSRSYSQLQITNPNSSFAACPGQWTQYQLNNSSAATTCFYTWTVTNGEIQGGFQNGNISTTSGYNVLLVSIRWFDITQSGSINVTSENCDNANGNGGLNLSIPIKSINGVNPATISGNSTVIVNATSNQVYAVPQINFPNVGSGDPNPFQVSSYEWQIPSGWTVVSGGSTKSITLKPDNCSGGSVRVRGKSTQCTSGPYYTNWSAVKTVTRTLAAPATIAGPDAVNCTDISVKTYSINAVTGATSYTWTLPSGWSGSSTTTSISATSNGLNGGAISVKANGCGIQSSASSKTISINLTNPNSPPGISGSGLVCYSGTTYTLSNLPAYASVTWAQSSNLTEVSGQGTTSYTVRANSTATSGSGRVDAVISTPCGIAPAIQYNVWVGRPPQPNNQQYYHTGNPANCVQLSIANIYTSTYWWTIASENMKVSATTLCKYGLVVEGGVTIEAPSLSVGPAVFSTQNFLINSQAKNACGLSPIFLVNIDYYTTPELAALSVYPNPASNEITVALEQDTLGYPEINEIALYTKHQQKILSKKEKAMVVKIPTHTLPDDTYYLRVLIGETIVERKIQIKH